jgi:mannose-6-phosphate isomerase-like protein (cupin superfamily)
MTEQACLTVARAIAAHLEHVPAMDSETDVEVAHLRRSARQAAVRKSFDSVSGRDYSVILDAAIASGRAHGIAPIAEALANLSAPLPWHYHYATRPGEDDLAGRIAFAELIGPDAPLDAPACRIGFTLMAPGTFYPLHAHPAIELYLVIAGNAQWTTPESDRIVPPGDFVLHRSNQPHAMRTHTEPLLALYGWRGDLETSAYYI